MLACVSCVLSVGLGVCLRVLAVSRGWHRARSSCTCGNKQCLDPLHLSQSGYRGNMLAVSHARPGGGVSGVATWAVPAAAVHRREEAGAGDGASEVATHI